MKQKSHFNKKPMPDKFEHTTLQQAVASYDWSQFDTFDQIPISGKTKAGLRKAQYFKPTKIQQQSIGYALCGNDILGAAKTGSGKTLAFLIPMLECLYKNQWTSMDGLGALIITPTRELSYQIFEVLNKVGFKHDFSVGLIIGGQGLKFEINRMDRCNIIVCTPGRLLQHMDKNPLFTCDNLKILILDEADRILDMGFAKQMNAIIENLSSERQTLLFSATQTKSVKDLARLSLKNPIFVSSHEKEKHSTPDNLSQSYIICPLEDKINLLWSFLRKHTKQKIIVFMSSCKQVKFIYELFCRLRPGIPLLALYGTLHQTRRMAIYDKFCQSSRTALFATDIVSRGLDFPAVNWVVQLDCPEDVNTYIHRVGRTARFEKGGESLLVLMPSEEQSMLAQLEENKVPIEKIAVNPKKITTIQLKAEAFLARDVALKESAQRAFKAYLKNIFLMKNKSVFRLDTLDLDQFARSLGLMITPRVRFIERKLNNDTEKKSAKIAKDKLVAHDSDKRSDFDSNESKVGHASLNFPNEIEDDDNGDLFQIKKVWRFDQDTASGHEENTLDLPIIENRKMPKTISKAALAKRLLKKNISLNTKIVFDEESGNQVFTGGIKQTGAKYAEADKSKSGIDIEISKKMMAEEDKVDKQMYRSLLKEKNLIKKMKLKAQKQQNGPIQLSNDSDNEATDAYIDALPDPSKIYGKDEATLSDDSFSASDGQEDSDVDNEFSLPNTSSSSKQAANLLGLSRATDADSSNEEEEYDTERRSVKRQKTTPDLNYYEEMALKLLNH